MERDILNQILFLIGTLLQGYWEKKPAIILKASVPRSANKDKRYVILFDHIWQYTDEYYEQLDEQMPPTFEGFMLAKCFDLYELFDLGTPKLRAA